MPAAGGGTRIGGGSEDCLECRSERSSKYWGQAFYCPVKGNGMMCDKRMVEEVSEPASPSAT